jgi:hypothetical protein
MYERPMKAALLLAALILTSLMAEADEMTSQLEFCERLAAAASASAERDILTERENLPPPMRSMRYGIRRVSDGRILKSDEMRPDMLDAVEVVLHCEKDGREHEVVWKPKTQESLEMLLRE